MAEGTGLTPSKDASVKTKSPELFKGFPKAGDRKWKANMRKKQSIIATSTPEKNALIESLKCKFSFRRPKTDVCDYCVECETKLKTNPNDSCKIQYTLQKTKAKKDANSVASFLHNTLEIKLKEFPDIRDIDFLFDAASGQNKNKTMIQFSLWVSK
ncbi:hypothetical protein C0J52_27503, partial [Blattella germanica]